MKAALALALLLPGLAACSGDRRCTVPEGVQPDWVRVIGCQADFDLLEAQLDDSVFARTQTVNVLIDREQDDRVYFIDSKEWELHYYFAAAYLDFPDKTPVGTHAEFNLLNYRRDGRRFVLGKVVRYLDQDLETLELAAGDTAGADLIEFAYRRIADSIYDGDRLLYRPVSARQEALVGELEQRIPVIRTEAVFQGQSYQPLHQTTGYGTLRFRHLAELPGRPVGPTDIVVLDRVPADLSLVSGVITDEFQTPLSHVNILSKNRGTPNMALRGAFDDPDLRALEGKLVKLEVTPQRYAVTAASRAEAEAFWDGLRPAEELVPALDESVTDLVDLAAVDRHAADSIGAKAANLAELGRVGGLPLPEAPFAIPLSAYRAHVEAAGLQPDIDQILADAAAGTVEPDALAARLFDLRWRIYRAPIDPALLAEITAAIEARWGAETPLRFRSSTNAEDLAEFSGAGIYTSAGASLSEGDEAIANAVKAVWASTWNFQAFVERDFYRVDQSRVRMAVLVHPAFEHERANGVAVTINEFASNRPAYYINSQVGEVSVTNPTGLATPEQILYYTWYEDPEYEVITRSSLAPDSEVLGDARLDELAAHLGAIHQHFRVELGGASDFAMDVEFKVDAAGRLVIKQARPLKRR